MTQPEALRLADRLMEPVVLDKHAMQAAAELRRLYAVNQDLLEALKSADETIDWLVLHLKQHHQCKHTDPTWSGIPRWIDKARAAIAKAEGKT